MHWTWCPACHALIKCPDAHCLGTHAWVMCPEHKAPFISPWTAPHLTPDDEV